MKVLKVKILETELEAALLNPETAEKYEKGFNECINRIRNAENNTKNDVDALQEQCNAVIDYINDVFGAGAGSKVFGEGVDLMTCLDALEEMADLYSSQINPLIIEKVKRINGILGIGQAND